MTTSAANTLTKENLKEREKIGLCTVDVRGKGLGVLAAKTYFKGDVLCEYKGERITLKESRMRLSNLTDKQGFYILDIERGRKSFSLDATKNDGRKGRLVNHSCEPNCKAEVRTVGNEQRVVLVAKQTIYVESEITFDYGDRSKESLEANPWLANPSH